MIAGHTDSVIVSYYSLDFSVHHWNSIFLSMDFVVQGFSADNFDVWRSVQAIDRKLFFSLILI